MKYLFYIPSIIGLLVCSCHAGEEQNQAENSPTPDNEFVEFTAMQYEAAGIRLGKAENKNLKQVVRASGYLEVPPQNEAKVAPMIGGIVKDIYVLEGNFVKKGQSLARIEHPDIIRLQEDYITAIANLGYLEKEYERQEALHEENVSAAKVFEQTEADYLTAHGRAKALANQLELLGLPVDRIAAGGILPSVMLRAPIAGYVGHINASIGAFAQPDTPLFDIVDNSKMHVDLLVYEKDLFKVKEGQRVSFVLTNRDDREIEGKIFGISRSFENETKALVVHAAIQGRQQRSLVAGMYVNALINVGDSTVTAVPRDAVVSSGGRAYLFVVHARATGADGGHIVFEMREIGTGVEELGYIEIRPMEPLPADAEIVVRGAFYVLSQLKVSGEEGDQ